MRYWESLNDMFMELNRKVNYLVLRNFEEFDNAGFLEGHPDIDFLCEDADKMADTLGAVPRGEKSDRTHFQVGIAGKTIPVDLREIGDGYYDSKWERDMLSCRQLYHENFYILSEENYLYSLIYHACIQKKELSREYESRISRMSSQCGKEMAVQDFIPQLESFMRANGYQFTYPRHPGGTVNFGSVDKKMIEKSHKKVLLRKVYFLKKKLRSIFK